MKENQHTQQDRQGFAGWVSCGIPEVKNDHAAFWQRWAQSKQSRKCPCGQMVLNGPCPVCGREYDSGKQE